jgi:dipeptidyl aminopeptidase/acylaminoacyl peptidase
VVIVPALLGLLAGASRPAISVGDIVGVIELSGLSVSPDGAWLAFRTEQADIATNGYKIQWWVTPTNGGADPRPVAEGGDALFTDAGQVRPETPVWMPDSRHLLFRALHAGAVEVWRASIGGREARRVTDDPGNILDFSLDVDGRTLRYHVGATRSAIDHAEQEAHDAGVLVDASVDIAQPVSRGAWLDGKPASERLTGDWFAHGNILWTAPIRTVTIALPAAAARTDGVAPRPTAMASIRSIDGDPVLFVPDAGGGEIRCDTAQCRVGRPMSARILADGRTWLVTTSDAAQDQTLSLWRPGDVTAHTLRAEGGQLSGDRQKDTPCAVGPTAIFCVEAAAASPPRLVSLDLASGAMRSLFDPNAGLRQRIRNPVRTVTWQAGKTAFAAKLILPSSPRPAAGYPLVMNYYDCPGFLRGGVGDELPMLPLAADGIAILCINRPRTSSDQRDAGSDYDRAVAGVTAIIDQLGHEALVDRRHVGMWGLSFGSEITMAIAQRTHLLSAASVSTGILEPAFYWFNGVAGRDVPDLLSKNFGVGNPDIDPASWARVSPALNTRAIDVPLLMQLAEQEARWSMQLYSTLSRSTTPVEMYAFANERHIKQQPRHRLAANQRNFDWFRYWLQGICDPDPAKTAQYQRWDRLSARRADTASTGDHPRP